MYKGLFQYYPATWSGSWNPWRRHSIFDGWAQIRATAYALSRGMGAQPVAQHLPDGVLGESRPLLRRRRLPPQGQAAGAAGSSHS